MALWLYDERGYPSGNAGGHHAARPSGVGGPRPADRRRGIDGRSGRRWTLPPGRLVLAAAFPVVDGVLTIDKAESTWRPQVRDGKLQWQRPGRHAGA